MRDVRTILAAAATLVVSGGSGAWAAGACAPIRLDAGRFSTTILGVAPAEDMVCYSMATGQGQRAALRVLSGRNTAITVEGEADARTAHDFTTERETYRILVFQLLRAAAPEAFAISVSVR